MHLALLVLSCAALLATAGGSPALASPPPSVALLSGYVAGCSPTIVPDFTVALLQGVCTPAPAPLSAQYANVRADWVPQTNDYTLSLFSGTCVGAPSKLLFGQGDQCRVADLAGAATFKLVTPIVSKCTASWYGHTRCTDTAYTTYGVDLSGACYPWLAPGGGSERWTTNGIGDWDVIYYSDTACTVSAGQSYGGEIDACKTNVLVTCGQQPAAVAASPADKIKAVRRGREHRPIKMIGEQ